MVSGVVLNETDVYREELPPPSLRNAVACVWSRRGDGTTVAVLPDGCTDIIWRPGSGGWVAGPDTGPAPARTEEQELILGVRWRPGAGGAAYGFPLSELRDLRLPLEEVGLDPAGELHGDLSPREALTKLTTLAARLVLLRPPDRAVQAAALRLSNPRARVDRLASEIGLSERQLRRRFDATVGYGPKTLQRVLRLRRFRGLWHLGLAEAAAEAGYSDQAHLTRDCRSLTSMSPGELRGRGPAASAPDGPRQGAGACAAVKASRLSATHWARLVGAEPVSSR